jgi:DNA-binding protein YbaB
MWGSRSGSAEDAAHWAADWSEQLARRAERSRSFADQVAQLTRSASSADGSVQVTVAASGAVTGLRLSELTRRRPADELAEQILAVMRQAQAQLAPSVAQVAAATLGPDDETARTVVASYRQRFGDPAPAPGPDDEAAGWRRGGGRPGGR